MLVTPEQAVIRLLAEDIVAIPTETVYGLAAIITSQTALKKIFETKHRPFFDPLIVHVENSKQAKEYTSEWPEIAEVLANHFWPGPLTLVLKKNQRISDLITAGLERVGLRCPNHQIALDIIKKAKLPLAAPSANLFGRTSPTSADHVEKEFLNQIAVVDGGSSNIGIESTVLLVDENELSILRPGQILAQDIENYLRKNSLSFSWKKTVSSKESPGHMKHHYMPSKPFFWIEGVQVIDLIEKLNLELNTLPREVEGVTLLRPHKISSYSELKLPALATEASRFLYAELRRLAEQPSDCLVFFPQKHMLTPEWEPILERLKKASSSIIKN